MTSARNYLILYSALVAATSALYTSCEISIREIPVGTASITFLSSPGEVCTFNLVGTNRQLYNVTGVGSILVIPMGAVENTGILQLTVGIDSAARTFGVIVFTVPVFSHVNPANFSTHPYHLVSCIFLGAGAWIFEFCSGGAGGLWHCRKPKCR